MDQYIGREEKVKYLLISHQGKIVNLPNRVNILVAMYIFTELNPS